MRLSIIASLILCLVVSGCSFPGSTEDALPAQAATASGEYRATATNVPFASSTILTERLHPLPTPNEVQAEMREIKSATATLPAQIASRFSGASVSSGIAAVNAQPSTVVFEHVVAWGDTLSQIAAVYGLSIETLMETNQLQNPDLLEVGQVLKLPPPPDSFGPSFRVMPDTRLVRSTNAQSFDVEGFVQSHAGVLRKMGGTVVSRQADGSTVDLSLTASEVIQRVSLDFSVDPRVLLAFLEYRAGLVSRLDVAEELLVYPLFSPETSGGLDRPGLYAQLIWLADQLNYGYYGKKYRGDEIVEFADGNRLLYHQNLNAASAAIQHVFARLTSGSSWEYDVGDEGFYLVYRSLFDDPLADFEERDAAPLTQPKLTLPFRPGKVWLFTGGYHGGWGSGSAWASVDFAPPQEEIPVSHCYTSTYPVTAVARGKIARLSNGVVVLDLDLDGNEGSGWTILYLHTSRVESVSVGQVVEEGEVLGYPSCEGGYSTATHLHIARRYNGEWIPADCVNCLSLRNVPAFVMSNWQVVGLRNQPYQGFMVNLQDNRSVVAEQGRNTNINQISW